MNEKENKKAQTRHLLRERPACRASFWIEVVVVYEEVVEVMGCVGVG